MKEVFARPSNRCRICSVSTKLATLPFKSLPLFKYLDKTNRLIATILNMRLLPWSLSVSAASRNKHEPHRRFVKSHFSSFINPRAGQWNRQIAAIGIQKRLYMLKIPNKTIINRGAFLLSVVRGCY